LSFLGWAETGLWRLGQKLETTIESECKNDQAQQKRNAVRNENAVKKLKWSYWNCEI